MNVKSLRTIVLLSAVFCLIFSAEGLAWVMKKTPHDLREAILDGTVKVSDAESATTFKLQCAPGKGGSLSLLYIVSDPKKIPRFPFDDFEGPDAPLAGRKLTSIHVASPGGKKTFETTVAGWYDNQGFVFSASQPFGKAGTARSVFELIRDGAQTLTWETADPHNIAWKLKSEFNLGAVTPELKEMLQACLPP